MRQIHYYRNDVESKGLFKKLLDCKLEIKSKEVYVHGEFIPFDFSTSSNDVEKINNEFIYITSLTKDLTRVNGVMSEDLKLHIQGSHTAWIPEPTPLDEYLKRF